VPHESKKEKDFKVEGKAIVEQTLKGNRRAREKNRSIGHNMGTGLLGRKGRTPTPFKINSGTIRNLLG